MHNTFTCLTNNGKLYIRHIFYTEAYSTIVKPPDAPSPNPCTLFKVKFLTVWYIDQSERCLRSH